jgi:integrase
VTVTLRSYKKRGKEGLEVDIRIEWPDRSTFRERRKSPVSGKEASLRWGRQREAELLRRGPDRESKGIDRESKGLDREGKELVPEPSTTPSETLKVPTLTEFAPRFVDLYARANGQSVREIENKESILKIHLLPHLGSKRLDEIKNAHIQNLKKTFREGYTSPEGKKIPPTSNPKTINNRLTVLGKLLHVAHDWGELPCPPPRIEVKAVRDNFKIEFFETEPLDRLLSGARTVGPEVYALVLLGCEAGLRRGELCGLEWSDLDFANRYVLVQRQVHKGKPLPPKGGKNRHIPLTGRLVAALQALRHLRGPRVFYHRDRAGKWRPLTPKIARMWMQSAERAAALPVRGALHILRHTFCSSLVSKGANVLQIQAYAGHEDLATTQRYMHLSRASWREGIDLLEGPVVTPANEGRG